MKINGLNGPLLAQALGMKIQKNMIKKISLRSNKTTNIRNHDDLIHYAL